MKLRRVLPHGRTIEQIKNHYEVEKRIADRIRTADREARKQLYHTVYTDLFSKVPDHPRLVRRSSEVLTERLNRNKLRLLSGHLNRSDILAEFAPGDCRFAMLVAEHVHKVYGVDISDQRADGIAFPENFKLIVYDGYSLEQVKDASIDLAFSDQLIEHLHPEDTTCHFDLVHRILKPGGSYIFRTPHAISGPHDISRYFCDRPEGLHLKEWTFTELHTVICGVGFSHFATYWCAGPFILRVPKPHFFVLERLLAGVSRQHLRPVLRLLFPSVTAIATKTQQSATPAGRRLR